MNDQHDLTTPDGILRTALEKETEASEFYAELLEDCSVEIVKDLLEKLHEEESKHARLIQDMLQKLSLGQKIA